MGAILAAVEAAGVPRADVRTSMLSVQPRYDYRDGHAPTLTGYELANVVEVTVRDLARLGDVVDGTLARRRHEHGRAVVPGRRPGTGGTRGPDRGDGRGSRCAPTSWPRPPG